MRGPIDYIVVGFTGDRFDGGIVRAIAEAVDAGVIALVALSAVRKDAEGNISDISITDLGELPAADPADLEEVAELLEPSSAAGLLVIEQLWAKPLKKAIIEAGGSLIAEGRIHPEAAQELDKETN